jgi:hypothetical protein
MAWLINERKRLRGQVDRWKKDLEGLPLKIAQYEAQLAALDAVFPLHEVKVEPKKIVGVRPQKAALLPYGALTRSVLSALRDAQSPLFTTEISLYVARCHGVDLSSVRKSDINQRVHRLVKKLKDKGIVEAVHAPGPTRAEGQWRLNADHYEKKAA